MSETPKVATWLLILMLLFSLAGFADAGYLALKHYTGGPVPCSITGGCDTVMSSPYASLGGIPVALFGAAYYLASFLLLIFHLDARRPFALTLVVALSAVGVAVSLALLYLMAFVIRSYCQYCLLSDLMSTGLFASSLAAVLRLRRARSIAKTITASSSD